MTDESTGDEPAGCPDGGYATAVRASPTSAGRWTPLRQVATVALTEYRLSVRNRWAFALVGLFAVFGAMLATFSGSAVGPEGMERVVASLTSLAVYLIPLAALAFGYDAIVGRDAEGWLAVVFSLPTTRARVVLGTVLGRALVLAVATVLGFGFVGLLLVREYGLARLDAVLAFLAGAVALGTVFLALAVLVSTVAREKTHALGLSLLVWVWFVLVHDLLALGVVAAVDLPDAAVTALVAANPASVVRVLVLQSLGTASGGGFTAVFAETGLSVGLLAAALLGWVALPVAAAALLVRRRRL